MYTSWMDIPKRAVRDYSHSFRITCDNSAVSLLTSDEQRYVKVTNNDNSSCEPVWPSGKALGW